MLTLFSTLISFLMGGLPKILDFFQDRSDKKHELELAQMQIARELEMRKLGFEAQERVENIHTQQLEIETKSNEKVSMIAAQQAEMQAIYAHDTALNEGTSQWMKNFQRHRDHHWIDGGRLSGLHWQCIRFHLAG